MKYGGPEGYKSHLEDLRQRQAARNPQKPLLTPSKRQKHRHLFDSMNTSLDDQASGPQGLWKLDPLPPVLQSVKDRFPTGSEWLWKTCNEKLDPGWDSLDMELAERARILGLVLDNPQRGALIPYPLRPPGSLAPSESVDKLHVILARAPRIPQFHSGYDEVPGMDRHEYWDPEWDVWYDWSSDYRNEVLEALIGVVKQHGAGDDGWALARWEVYDTYTQCLSGISYDNWKGGRWVDNAKHWLDASVARGSKLGKELDAFISQKGAESGGGPS